MVDTLEDFTIAFMGLKDGHHQFDYRIEETFFTAFENEEGLTPDIICHVDFEKKQTMLVLDVTFEGTVKADCDRCTEECEVAVKGEEKLYYKFSESAESDDVDVYAVGPQDISINIAQPLYDYIRLSVPARRVHKDGECDPEMIEALYGTDDSEDEGTDPRWDALKKLK